MTSAAVLVPENRILRDIITMRLSCPEAVDTRFCEFDDVSYHVTGPKENPASLTVSLALPRDTETGAPSAPPEGAAAGVEEMLPNIARVVDTEAGYSITVEMSLDQLPADEDGRAALISRLASVRILVMGAPLRALLSRLAEGQSAEGPLQAIPHRPEETFFARPESDHVEVIFPMKFRDASDGTIASSFLAEFAEARRLPGFSTSPSCAYSKTLPPELAAAEAGGLLGGAANAGYITFLLFQRHVEGGRLDKVVWSMSTFYAYVSYHIKCSKAFMHSNMRQRASSLLGVLGRARPAADAGEKKDKRKTAQGRNFVRAV